MIGAVRMQPKKWLGRKPNAPMVGPHRGKKRSGGVFSKPRPSEGWGPTQPPGFPSIRHEADGNPSYGSSCIAGPPVPISLGPGPRPGPGFFPPGARPIGAGSKQRPGHKPQEDYFSWAMFFEDGRVLLGKRPAGGPRRCEALLNAGISPLERGGSLR